jgi:hypothetical protein
MRRAFREKLGKVSSEADRAAAQARLAELEARHQHQSSSQQHPHLPQQQHIHFDDRAERRQLYSPLDERPSARLYHAEHSYAGHLRFNSYDGVPQPHHQLPYPVAPKESLRLKTQNLNTDLQGRLVSPHSATAAKRAYAEYGISPVNPQAHGREQARRIERERAVLDAIETQQYLRPDYMPVKVVSKTVSPVDIPTPVVRAQRQPEISTAGGSLRAINRGDGSSHLPVPTPYALSYDRESVYSDRTPTQSHFQSAAENHSYSQTTSPRAPPTPPSPAPYIALYTTTSAESATASVSPVRSKPVVPTSAVFQAPIQMPSSPPLSPRSLHETRPMSKPPPPPYPVSKEEDRLMEMQVPTVVVRDEKHRPVATVPKAKFSVSAVAGPSQPPPAIVLSPPISHSRSPSLVQDEPVRAVSSAESLIHPAFRRSAIDEEQQQQQLQPQPDPFMESPMSFESFRSNPPMIFDSPCPPGNSRFSDSTFGGIASPDPSLYSEPPRLSLLNAKRRAGALKNLQDIPLRQHIDFDKKEMLPLEHIARLGDGDTCIVDEVRNVLTGQVSARKLMSGRTQKSKTTFRKELDILNKLRHHHVIHCIGSYTQGLEIAMLLLPCAEYNLDEFIRNIVPNRRVAKTREILYQAFGCLATAVQYLHSHAILHKDLRPQNILLKSGQVYLADFGTSINLELTRDNTQLGSPPTEGLTLLYCAPEMIKSRRYGKSADIWSLGCTYLQMLVALTGHHLFELDSHIRGDGTQPEAFFAQLGVVDTWIETLLEFANQRSLRHQRANIYSEEQRQSDAILPMLLATTTDMVNPVDQERPAAEVIRGRFKSGGGVRKVWDSEPLFCMSCHR